MQDNNGKNSLKLFPNPATGKFSIQFKSPYPLTSRVTIFDQAGKTVKELHWESSGQIPLFVNTKYMTDGVYYVKISNAEFSTTRKLVVLKK